MQVLDIGPNKKGKKLKFITDEDKKTRKKRIIAGSFIVFIVMLATTSVLYFLKAYDYDLSKVIEKETDKGSKTQETTSPVKMKGCANFLFAGSSTKKDELFFVSLVKIDLDKMQASVCCLPINAVVSVNGSSATLEGNFKSGGAKQLSEAVCKYANTSVDRYVVVGEKNFKTIIRYLGNYTLTLDEKISYNSGELSINFMKGKQTLTGDKLMHYIRYQEKVGYNYLNAQAKIICDMIDQMLVEKNVDKGEDLFNSLINLVDSNISIMDYTKNHAYIEGYVESEKRQASIPADVSTFEKEK